MGLSNKRITQGNETPHTHEREGVEFILECLPDCDPFHAWPLHELLDESTSRLYEIDMLVLTRQALFLIEIKSHPGTLTGDNVDWFFTDENMRPRYLRNPYNLTNHKAKVLADCLRRTIKNHPCPWVQPLVFLSHEDVRINLKGTCPSYVTKRDTIRDTLVNFRINQQPSRNQVVNRPVMEAVKKALHHIGLRPSHAAQQVGEWRLKTLLEDQAAYQEHMAEHSSITSDKARIRTYLVPRATTRERRDQLNRAAEREAEILARLQQHPKILRYREFKADSEKGPAILFEDFAGAVPLREFLKQHPDLPLDERVSILEYVVEAMDHCHREEIVHRNLCPGALLVKQEEHVIDVRLHHFQSASSANHTSLATSHISDWRGKEDELFIAPEVLENPAQATLASDMFSLGCLAWFIFTGKPPADKLDVRHKILEENDGLRITSVRDDLARLEDGIRLATQIEPLDRPDNALDWFQIYILDPLTSASNSDHKQVDPYNAKRNEPIGDRWEMVRLLGSGATARVLLLREREEPQRYFALKVPHDTTCSQRLQEEAGILARLHNHQNIITLHQTLELQDRYCLLLDYAGLNPQKVDGDDCHSLAALLRKEGSLSLDRTRRYGYDLLSALQHLEEHGLTHRDIKPSNLGFSSEVKKVRHLVLYDFSLTTANAGDVTIGTPDWRDPWLHTRGRWDHHADQFAAAAVLYRMLTGTRPTRSQHGKRTDQIHIEADRFDPGLRNRLLSFFKKAFAKDIDARFTSAEQMRQAWEQLFLNTVFDQVASADNTALPKAKLDTSVEMLGLSARARNALDRAGVMLVRDLLQLPNNHLSAIRGVGRTVAKEIQDKADQLRNHLTVEQDPPLLPDYSGPITSLDDSVLGLSPAQIAKLADAGIASSHELATTAASRLQHLLGESESHAVKTALETFARDNTPEGTLAEWVHALLLPKKRNATVAEHRIAALVGLDPLPSGGTRAEGRVENGPLATKEQVAQAFGISIATMHNSLKTMRDRWEQDKALDTLRQAVDDLMQTRGPLCTFGEASLELARQRGLPNPSDSQRRYARALLRVALECRQPAIHWQTINQHAWIAKNTLWLNDLARMAAIADEQALMDPLPATEAVRDTLIADLQSEDLKTLPPDRLLHLAAQASQHAAVSARLELYPVGMSAQRAVKLSLNVFSGSEPSAQDIQQRVASRYPRAERLPDRPQLDDLLAPFELVFDTANQRYKRREAGGTSLTPSRLSRQSSAKGHQRVSRSPEAMEAQRFEDLLKSGVAAGRWRVVQVLSTQAEQAVPLLAQWLGVKPTSLDHAIWQSMKQLAAENQVDINAIWQADHEGPDGSHWHLLCDLAQTAADHALNHLLDQRDQPQLLIHPGLLARYQLRQPLYNLAHRAQTEEGAAVLLVVPCHDNGLPPSINDQLPVPTDSDIQRMRLPESWLRNAHRAAALSGE